MKKITIKIIYFYHKKIVSILFIEIKIILYLFYFNIQL